MCPDTAILSVPSAPAQTPTAAHALTHWVFGWAAADAMRQKATSLEPIHFLTALRALHHHLPSSSILGDLVGDMAEGGTGWPSYTFMRARQVPRTPKVWDSAALPLSRSLAWRLRNLTNDPSTLSMKDLVDWVVTSRTGKPATWRKVEPASEAAPDPVHPLIRCAQNARRLEAHLRSRVLGQGDAVRAMAEAYIHAQLIQNRKSPSILTFLGLPGTGKTLAARAFHEALVAIDGEESWGFVEFPLSQGDFSLGRLQQGLHEYPRSIVLLDEIEKAGSSTLASLLPVLAGDPMKTFDTAVDCRDAWFVITTNLGAESLDEDGGGTQGGLVQDPFEILRNAKYRTKQWDREAVPVLAPEFVSRLAQGRAVIFSRPAAHHMWALADRNTHL